MRTFVIEKGRGYLYANALDTTLLFEGKTAGVGAVYTISYYASNGILTGCNIMGNPLPCDAYIDRSYYDTMANKAIETISLYGDFDAFVDVDTVPEFTPHLDKLDFHACQMYREKTPDGEMDWCWKCPFRHSHDAEPWAEPDICEKGYDIHDLIPF